MIRRFSAFALTLALFSAPVSAALLSTETLHFPTRTALAGQSISILTDGDPAIISEAGQQGTFEWDTANHSGDITAQGSQIGQTYVAPNDDPDGSSGAWVRFPTDNFSDQSTAEAGSSNARVMTPLRAEQHFQAATDRGYFGELVAKATLFDPTFGGGVGGPTAYRAAWIFSNETNHGAVPDQQATMIIRGASYNGVDGGTVLTLSQHTALIVVGQSCDTPACGQIDFRTSTSQGEVGALKIFGMHPRRSDQGTMQITTLRTYVPGTTDGGSNSIEGSFALIDPSGNWEVGEHYYVGGFTHDLAGTLDPFDTEDRLRGVVMEASSKPPAQVIPLVYGMGPAFQAIDNPNGLVGWRWLIAGYNTRTDALPYVGITGYDHPTSPGRLLVADGIAAEPSLSFMSEEVLGDRYGFYKPDATSIGVSLNGVLRQQFRADGYYLRENVAGTQVRVVGVRQTGWVPDTGTDKRTANATYAASASGVYNQTQIQTLMNAVRDATQTIKALKVDLTTHGLIGS